jgi:hypothetical protein
MNRFDLREDSIDLPRKWQPNEDQGGLPYFEEHGFVSDDFH